MKKYVQISAGRGPVECARAVTLVAREFCRYCAGAGIGVELTESEPHNGFDDCYMSMIFSLDGEITERLIGEWEGTVLWLATRNPYRPGHKRKNWFVKVHFFDAVELPEISEKDLEYESCRSGGKGGQNVNKVETAVRVVHRPTGLAVKCSDERSRYRNQALARERLLLKLHRLSQEALAGARSEQWRNHDRLERGNPVRKFTGAL